MNAAAQPTSSGHLDALSGNRSFTSRVSSTLLISVFSRAMIACGVFAGTRIPYQLVTSYPGSVSAIAGVSGSAVLRFALVTARPRSLPDLICGIAGSSGLNVSCVSPLIVASNVSAAPFIGDRRDLYAGHRFQELARKVIRCALAGRCVIELAGFRFGKRDQFLH
jgi:hypothetical protein